MGYLDTLKPHQLNGFEAFRRWYESSSPAAVLVGRGGTGKTYSIGRYVLELGIDPMQVLAVAPTNTAAKRLSTDMAMAGLKIGATTVHKALALRPEPQKWRDEDDARMRKLTALIAKVELEGIKDSEAAAQFRAHQVELSYLHRKLDAFRKKKLIFSPSEVTEDGETFALYVVDECSMIPEEITELMTLSWCKSKILFLGDPKQMLPVGEGLSKSFDFPWIAEFTQSERAKGNLAKIHAAVADSGNYRAAAEILKGLPHWEDFGVDHPWEIPANEAAIITRSESRGLMERWVETLPFDGLSYRLVAYKNETIGKINDACLEMAGFKCPQPGWSMIAKSPVNRGGSVGNGVWQDDRILQTSEMVILNGVKGTTRPYVPGFGEFTLFKLSYGMGGAEFFGDDVSYIYPEKSFLGGWGPDPAFTLKWSNDPVLTTGCKYWRDTVSSLYFKGNTPPQPSANQNIEMLFDFLGADSWCNFVGVPGKSTYKSPKSGKLNYDFLLMGASQKEINKFHRDVLDSEGRPIFPKFRLLLWRLEKWLSEKVVDPVSMVSASTVYKAQGATIGNVAMPLEELTSSARFGANAGENTLRALYTATSRSSERLFVIV